MSPINLPTKMRVSGRGAKITDFNSAYRIFLVNRRFLDVVERFQTEIQSFPVDCISNDGKSVGDYYFFFTTVLVDAVVREKTTATWKQLLPNRGFWRPELHKAETFVFDKARLGGRHIWVDPNMPEMGALVTEALYSALEKAKIESFYGNSGFAET